MADEKKWALLIGINHHERAEVAPLAYAVNDVHALAETLINMCDFLPEHVFTVTSDDPVERPTRSNIAYRLDYIATQAKPEDTVVFFFVGHGLSNRDTSYLLTYEADPRSHVTIAESCLSARRLQEWLNRLPARTVVALYDAFRDAPFTPVGNGRRAVPNGRSAVPADNLLTETAARDLRIGANRTATSAASARATLFACKVGQRAYESEEKQHGFFTHYLIEGLKGDAVDIEGRATLDALESYLSRMVSQATLLEKGAPQEPWVSRDGAEAGRVCLALHDPPVATLIVTSDPEDASVFVNGKYTGLTPLTRIIELGTLRSLDVEVSLLKDGYHTQVRTLRLQRASTSDWTDGTLMPLMSPPVEPREVVAVRTEPTATAVASPEPTLVVPMQPVEPSPAVSIVEPPPVTPEEPKVAPPPVFTPEPVSVAPEKSEPPALTALTPEPIPVVLTEQRGSSAPVSAPEPPPVVQRGREEPAPPPSKPKPASPPAASDASPPPMTLPLVRPVAPQPAQPAQPSLTRWLSGRRLVAPAAVVFLILCAFLMWFALRPRSQPSSPQPKTSAPSSVEAADSKPTERLPSNPPTETTKPTQPPIKLSVTVCAESGNLPTPYCPKTEAREFAQGNLPTKLCPIHQQPLCRNGHPVEKEWKFCRVCGVALQPPAQPKR